MPPFCASETAPGRSLQLPRDRARDSAGEPLRRRDQDCARVRIVLGLGNQVGGDPFGTAGFREDGDLARPGEEIDRAIAGDECLCGGHVRVSGPHDLVHLRHGRGAVRECANGVGSADPEQPIDTSFPRRAQDCRVRPGAHGHDLAHARYARGIAVIKSDDGSG
jgi:hypothetical protein